MHILFVVETNADDMLVVRVIISVSIDVCQHRSACVFTAYSWLSFGEPAAHVDHLYAYVSRLKQFAEICQFCYLASPV